MKKLFVNIIVKIMNTVALIVLGWAYLNTTSIYQLPRDTAEAYGMFGILSILGGIISLASEKMASVINAASLFFCGHLFLLFLSGFFANEISFWWITVPISCFLFLGISGVYFWSPERLRATVYC